MQVLSKNPEQTPPLNPSWLRHQVKHWRSFDGHPCLVSTVVDSWAASTVKLLNIMSIKFKTRLVKLTFNKWDRSGVDCSGDDRENTQEHKETHLEFLIFRLYLLRQNWWQTNKCNGFKYFLILFLIARKTNLSQIIIK